MQLIRRFRVSALLCSVAVLLCELIARPYTTMGVCDDGPYILMARTLADTGHIVYNGWPAAMLVAQLYLGAAFIKLFGYSFTTVRMSTLMIAVVMAFVIQRTLVRAGISERNATIGTLALVLSPLYLMLSPTFMSDIMGLFAIVICLYGCLRALQSLTDRSAVSWIAFAVLTNAIVGTSRQIAWLGILVMVPSTLWLLRSRRRVLLAGTIATLAGAIFIVACLQWLKQQPYVFSVPLLVKHFPVTTAIDQLALLLLGIPFLLLPITAAFLPEIGRARPAASATVTALLLGFSFLATYPSHLRGGLHRLLEPTSGGGGSWVTTRGLIKIFGSDASAPTYLNHWVQLALTIITYGGLAGISLIWLRSNAKRSHTVMTDNVSWKDLCTILAPFAGAYILLLIATVGTTFLLFDRYALGLLIVALILGLRFYQERVSANPSLVSIAMIVIMAIYGITVTYNNYSFYRARVALASELINQGVPATSIDNGWEYNFDVELQHASHINLQGIRLPKNAYTPPAPLPNGTCPMFWYDRTPHIHPIYGVSFDPNACYGLAPFQPVHYFRWPFRTPGTLYVVNYLPPSRR